MIDFPASEPCTSTIQKPMNSILNEAKALR